MTASGVRKHSMKTTCEPVGATVIRQSSVHALNDARV